MLVPLWIFWSACIALKSLHGSDFVPVNWDLGDLEAWLSIRSSVTAMWHGTLLRSEPHPQRRFNGRNLKRLFFYLKHWWEKYAEKPGSCIWTTVTYTWLSRYAWSLKQPERMTGLISSRRKQGATTDFMEVVVHKTREDAPRLKTSSLLLWKALVNRCRRSHHNYLIK